MQVTTRRKQQKEGTFPTAFVKQQIRLQCRFSRQMLEATSLRGDIDGYAKVDADEKGGVIFSSSQIKVQDG